MAEQGSNKANKGNPAGHRMGNKERHARRQQRAATGAKRRTEKARAQELRHAENVATVREGGLTPWQQAKAKRADRRAKDPRVLRARRLHMSDALRMPTDAGHRA
jgi:hypothetical protein